jgi:hypothetical protein
VLLDHPAVTEAAVVGFADAVLGEKVVAFVVPASDPVATQEQIRRHCQAHLGTYKVPQRVAFLDQLPRNPAGKVLKTKLREMELSNLQPPAGQSKTSQLVATSPAVAASRIEPAQSSRPELPNSGPLFQQLQATHPASRERMLTSLLQDELRSLTGRSESIDPDTPILDEQIDSLMIVEFRDRLQLQVGSRLQLPATLVFDHPKLSDLARHLLDSLEREDEPQPMALATGLRAASATPNRPAASTVGSDGRRTRVLKQGQTVAAVSTLVGQALETSAAQPRPREQIESMSEQQAMEALLREVND